MAGSLFDRLTRGDEGARMSEDESIRLHLLRLLTCLLYTSSIDDHPREALNGRWWVVTVRHEGQQPGVLEHEAPDGRGLHYASRAVSYTHLPREALNAGWWVVTVHHEGQQPGVLEHEAPDGRGLHYACLLYTSALCR